MVYRRYRRASAARKIQRAFRRRRPKRTLNSRIKRISLKQSETKTSHQKEIGQDLFHNLTHYYPNLLACDQGVSNPIGTSQDSRNRIGSEIKAVGLRIKNQIISTPGRPNCNYMIYIFWYRAANSLNDSTFWSGPSGGGATNNRFLDHPQPAIYRIIKKMFIQNLNNYDAGGADNRVHTAYRETYIPLKLRTLRYNQNSTLPEPWTIGMAVTAFDANNTAQTDQLADSNFATTFYYKDP